MDELSDEARALYEELEERFERYCYEDLSFEPLPTESLDALRRLPVAARERLALALPPSPGGPHAHVATPAVAALAIELLLTGDRFIGTEILAGMREEHVVEALRERGELASTDPRALSWTLPRGLAGGGHVTRVECVDAPVLDVAIVDECVLASCRDGSLHRFEPEGRSLVVSAGEMDHPSQRLAVQACRLVAVTQTLVVRWGWEHMVAVDRLDGATRWELHLGHGFDGYRASFAVFGRLVEMGDGTFVDLDAGAWLPPEAWAAAEAEVCRLREAGEAGITFGPEARRGALHVSGTDEGLVVWRAESLAPSVR